MVLGEKHGTNYLPYTISSLNDIVYLLECIFSTVDLNMI